MGKSAGGTVSGFERKWGPNKCGASIGRHLNPINKSENLPNQPVHGGRPRRSVDVKKAAVIEVLNSFFNLIMVVRLIPILIPKEGKDDSKAKNYRPITISSILSRIYFGILDQRARGVVRFSPRQKGFIKEAGWAQQRTNFRRSATALKSPQRPGRNDSGRV
ncbi:hypothetical protein JTB14_015040 [Gonioctena quinquepunctata]|nr:hypothetical protein JTB14_015040 [Gonioctena quinquepunctata]